MDSQADASTYVYTYDYASTPLISTGKLRDGREAGIAQGEVQAQAEAVQGHGDDEDEQADLLRSHDVTALCGHGPAPALCRE